jgi:hypothetical protein
MKTRRRERDMNRDKGQTSANIVTRGEAGLSKSVNNGKPTDRRGVLSTIPALTCSHLHWNIYQKFTCLWILIGRDRLAVIFLLKNSVNWVVTPCGSCKDRSYGGTYRFHHQGDKNQRCS